MRAHHADVRDALLSFFFFFLQPVQKARKVTSSAFDFTEIFCNQPVQLLAKKP